MFKDRPNLESSGENQDLDNIQYDVNEGEREDIVLNSEITDELIPEFFINSIDYILHLINRLFSRIFDLADFPPPWCYFVIVKLFKKGDVNKPDSYRGL